LRCARLGVHSINFWPPECRYGSLPISEPPAILNNPPFTRLPHPREGWER
jgi:hypothetical protein